MARFEVQHGHLPGSQSRRKAAGSRAWQQGWLGAQVSLLLPQPSFTSTHFNDELNEPACLIVRCFLAWVMNHPQHASRGAGDACAAWGAPGRAPGMLCRGCCGHSCWPWGPGTLEVLAACVQPAVSHSTSSRFLPFPALSNRTGSTGRAQMLLLQFV